jgi:hypothetical protein
MRIKSRVHLDWIKRRGASQKQAVLEGIAAAKANFGKAPVTDNDADPVRSLLNRTSAQTPAAAGSGADALSASARDARCASEQRQG